MQKYKKARYAIGNVGEKDLSTIIKEVENIGKLPIEMKTPKHEPTHSYFYIVRQLAKCMMKSEKLNRHDHISYTEETAPALNVNGTDEGKSKEIIVHKTLSENLSMDVSISEHNIVNKTLSQTITRTYQKIPLRN